MDHCFYDEMKPIPTNLKIPEEIEMRALLRDAQDQTRIALEVEEAVYDPRTTSFSFTPPARPVMRFQRL